MLPAASRMRRSEDFRVTLRRGRRAAGSLMVVHLLSPGSPPVPARTGFVVARDVGGAVRRNRLRRRLRAACAGRVTDLPPGSLLVVRARPAAAAAPFSALVHQLDAALDRLGLRVGGR